VSDLIYPKRLKALLGKNRWPREAKDYAGTWILKPETWNALKKVAETRKALQAPWSGAQGIRRVDTLPGAIVEQAVLRKGSERAAG
jgi:hypothetical protein